MDNNGSVPSASSEMDGVTTSLERAEDFRFTHPAGLRIARHLTKSLIEALSLKIWMELDGNISLIRQDGSESSSMKDPASLVEPEVLADLGELLAFEDASETATPRYQPTTSNTSFGERISTSVPSSAETHTDMRELNSTEFPSDSLINSWLTPDDFDTIEAAHDPSSFSYSSQPASRQATSIFQDNHMHDDQNSFENTQFSVVSRPPSTEASRSAFNLPPPRALNSQSQQPSHTFSAPQEGRLTPQASASQQRPPHLPSPLNPSRQTPNLGPGQFPNPLQLPKIDLPPLGNALGPVGISANRHPLPSIGSPDTSNHMPLNQFHSIKSFLPVNKSGSNSNTPEKAPCLPPGLSNSPSKIVDANNLQTPHLLNKQAASPPSKQTTADKYSLSANPTNSSQSTPTAQFFSQTLYDFSSGSLHTTTMGKRSIDKMPAKKRKAKDEADTCVKKQKLDKKGKAAKKDGEEKERLGDDIWMRIFEFTPPSFLKKARLVCKPWKAMVDQFDSIFVNCRKENYGWDMPPPPPGMTERQYSDLLGGKGCQEPGCDNKKATRTYWSWSKRWCSDCWGKKIEREDRILKNRQNNYPRTTVLKMLESIPVAIYDSFLKPHDYTEEVEARARGPPRLYKCYLISDVDRIIEEYNALAPPPYEANPDHTPAEASAAQAAHKDLMDALDGKRDEFFAAKKAVNDKHMGNVRKIEAAIRKKRQEERGPKDKARKGRIELFTRRAKEDLPQIPTEFVQVTKAFKAACRIYRDGGTERGWRSLKPKIEKEWEERDLNPPKSLAGTNSDIREVSMDADSLMSDMDEYPSLRSTPAVDIGRAVQQQQPQHSHARPQSIYGNAQQVRPNHPLRQSIGSMGGPLGFNNYGTNLGGYNYTNFHHAGALLSQPAQITSAYPGGSFLMGGLPRALPQPNNFRQPQFRHQTVYDMHSNYHNQQPSHLGSQSTHIPINSLLGPSNPPNHQKHNTFQ